MRFRPVACCVAAALQLVGMVSAARAECEGLEPIEPTIEVTADEGGEPRIVPASTEEIAREAASMRRKPGPGRLVAGLTTTTVRGDGGFTLAKADRPGASCVALRSVRARLEQRDVTILIDRRYQKGTCQYDAILDHEREHVRINTEALHEGEVRLRQELEAALASVGGRWYPADQQPRIADTLQRTLAAAVPAIQADAARGHAAIDSEEAYARVQRRCPSW